MKPVSLPVAVLMTFVGGTLDAYTFITHGVFATAQTGNVVLLLVGIVDGSDAFKYVWPILAFTVAVMVVQPVKHIASPRRAHTAAALVLAFEILILLGVGFVPASSASEWIAIPLSALAGLQLGLFRSVRNASFASIATTGNLMRFAEAGYEALVGRNRTALRSFIVCASIVIAFGAGALTGAVLTHLFGSAAIWFSALAQGAVLVLYAAQRPAFRPSEVGTRLPR
ncbi:MAG TPA: YoaK family protein [Galbitalea sp.]|jgi:uncharacterized membrane protein YoaK (UPF0700 family)